MEKDVNFNIVSRFFSFSFFFHFFHFFAFKNTLEKLAKWTLQWKFLVHPSVHSPTTKAKALKDNRLGECSSYLR
jgi:hypothetical protein